MGDYSDDEETYDLSDSEVVDKYKAAGNISNAVLAHVVTLCVPGASVPDICQAGDDMIFAECNKIYTKAKLEKGIAFPTCISVNNCAGHVSPLSSTEMTLNDGDVVKIDLATHIDGFIAPVAHTIICVAPGTTEATKGRKADVVCAAYFASEIALRLLRPNNKNTQITEALQKVAEEFNCNVVEGVLSHEMNKFVIDGAKCIISKNSPEQHVDEFTFEVNEVYSLDIVMSTGEGKLKEQSTRTTVYKREVDVNYKLKLPASRYVFNEVNAKYPATPFSLRAFDEKRGRLGIVEMLKHGMVTPYPVLYEKEGEFVAQFKMTVLLLPSSIQRITGHPAPFVSSEFSIKDPKLLQIQSLGLKRSKKKKKKKKKKAATPAAE